MFDRFAAAGLKIERANKHITDLEAIVLALPDAYASTIESNVGGGQTVKYTAPLNLPQRAAQMALIIGDAIHNLRVSVEYAYLGAVERHAPSVLDSYTKFPTGQTRKNVEDALKNRKLDVLSPKLFQRVVSDIKPYEVGGNCLVKILHDLDISDKHWLLTPLMRVATVTDVVVEDEIGHPVTSNTWPIYGDGPYFIDFGPRHKVKNKGKLSIDVVFDDSEFPLLDGISVMDDLKDFSKIAAYVIQALDSI